MDTNPLYMNVQQVKIVILFTLVGVTLLLKTKAEEGDWEDLLRNQFWCSRESLAN